MLDIAAHVKKTPRRTKKYFVVRIFIRFIGFIKLKREKVNDPTIKAEDTGIRLSFNKSIEGL